MDENSIWEHCNKCSGQRKHEILYEKEEAWSEDIAENCIIDGGNTYTLLQCCGCENVTLKRQSWNSENYNLKTGKPEIYTDHFPPLTFRKKPKWLTDLFFLEGVSNFIEDFITEIYIALQNNAPRLATMGIRGLLEHVMIDKVGDNGSFIKNIKAFESEGYISEKQRAFLESVLEAGHAAMHRAFKPENKDLIHLMDITESIIETVYIHQPKAEKITKKIPKRN